MCPCQSTQESPGPWEEGQFLLVKANSCKSGVKCTGQLWDLRQSDQLLSMCFHRDITDWQVAGAQGTLTGGLENSVTTGPELERRVGRRKQLHGTPQTHRHTRSRGSRGSGWRGRVLQLSKCPLFPLGVIFLISSLSLLCHHQASQGCHCPPTGCVTLTRSPPDEERSPPRSFPLNTQLRPPARASWWKV